MNNLFKPGILAVIILFASCKNKTEPQVQGTESIESKQVVSTKVDMLPNDNKIGKDTIAPIIDSIRPSKDTIPIFNEKVKETTSHEKKETQDRTTSKLPKQKEALPEREIVTEKVNKAPSGNALIHFENEYFDFGELKAGDEIRHKFHFTNNGSTPLVIHSATATCGCTVPSYPFIPIEPGEKGYIGVHYNSVGKEGVQKPIITITSNARNEPVKKLYLKGTVIAKSSSEKPETKDSIKQ